MAFLTTLRAEYDNRFASPGVTKFMRMSTAGTLAGCLSEVLPQNILVVNLII